MESPLDIEDRAALARYLADAGRGRLASFEVLAGGVSSRTVRVAIDGATGAWVLKQALPKLRVAVDWFSDPARVHREALGIRWLGQLAPPGAVPQLVFEDEAHHVLAMTAVPTPHENWKSMLMAGRVVAGHVEQFGRLLGTVHRNARDRRAEVAPAFADRSFFESLRVEPYYEYAAARSPAAAPFLGRLIAETRATAETLVHGDYSPKNVLVRDGRLVLLDHEVIHWGDPAFDAGFALAHLLSKAHHLPAHRDAFGDAACTFASVWVGELGSDGSHEPRAVRHALGCLLARVIGRSPLEYLTDAGRAAQRAAVERLMSRPPATVPALADAFLNQV